MYEIAARVGVFYKNDESILDKDNVRDKIFSYHFFCLVSFFDITYLSIIVLSEQVKEKHLLPTLLR